MKRLLQVLQLYSLMACSWGYGQAATYPSVVAPEASIASLMRFEEFAVSNYTGVPDVSIPLFSLPTKSKDLSLQMALGYHPSSVSVYEGIGECGRGWSLFAGGVISRTVIGDVDEVILQQGMNQTDDVYQFNFMGHMGRFYMKKDASGALNIRVLENKGAKLALTFVQHPTNYTITSFTIYDDKGNKFVFEDRDREVQYIYNTFRTFNGSYHLSKVYDNNGIELMGFTYQDNVVQVPGDGSGQLLLPRIYKKTKEITVPGYGKVGFTYSTLAGNTSKLTELLLSDQFGTPVRKAKLIGALKEVVLSDPAETLKESYKLTYGSVEEPGSGRFGADKWGYRNYTPSCLGLWYDLDKTEPSLVTGGVLEKMTLPTGGCIIYGYESNTFGNSRKFNPETQQMEEGPFDVESYYKEDYYNYLPENHIVETIGNATFTPGGTNITLFQVTAANPTIYIQAEGFPYTIGGIENGNNNLYPRFTISGPGLAETTLEQGSNYESSCMGNKFTLSPGFYTISILTVANAHGDGQVTIRTRKRNPNVKKWFYGGGIRIREIGYFDADAPYNYYRNKAHANSMGYFPVREKRYAYHFFGEPNSSSGYVAYDGFYLPTNARARKEQIGYQNVTVYDTGVGVANGRTEYTYTVPRVNNVGNELVQTYYDYKRGLVTNQKVYNSANELQASTDFTYEYVESPDFNVLYNHPALNEKLGWAKLVGKTSKNYYSNSATPVTVTESFTYSNLNRKPLSQTIAFGNGETQKTEYTYHNGNSTLSQNRISMPETVKTYENGELLSATTINYSNAWPGNVSYLPSFIASSKGPQGVLKPLTRYTLYDDQSNVLEARAENGLPTTYIWGYNKTLLIAKIENMAYATVNSSLVAAAQTASNTANNEAAVLTALTNLRNSLPNALITTYTYKPLVGVSTIIDPKGDKATYNYDSLGRLTSVKDKSGYILTLNNYNYRTQN